MKSLFSSFLPDFGPHGFYEGFLHGLTIIGFGFVLGGLEKVVPLLNTLLLPYVTPTGSVIVTTILGGLLWAVRWVYTHSPKEVQATEPAPMGVSATELA